MRLVIALFCLLLTMKQELYCWGVAPDRPIRQLHHTAWNEASGLTGNVYSISQTTNGYLWIGTTTGLFRFDGIRFDLYHAPNGTQPITEARALLPTSDGGLWIAHRSGVAFVKGDKLTSFGEQQGLPYGRARGLAQTSDGSIWVSLVGGLAHFSNGHWEKVRANWSYPDKTANRMVVDDAGTLWVSGEDTVRYLLQGEHAFRETGIKIGNFSILRKGPPGSILVSDFLRERVLQLARRADNGKVEVLKTLPFAALDVLVDRAGTIWLATFGAVYRLRPGDLMKAGRASGQSLKSDAFKAADGLSDKDAYALFEDREGNMWAGTAAGLDRFRDRNATQFNLSDVPAQLVAGPGAQVWASLNQAPALVPLQNSTPFPTRPYASNSTYMDRQGTLWAGMQAAESSKSLALWKFQRSGATKITPPPGMDAPFIKGIVSDPTGKLWMTISGGGEYTWKDGVWTRIPVFEAKDSDLAPDAQFVDSAGRAWLAYYARATVAMIEGDKKTFFTHGKGFDLGNPIVGGSSGANVWIAGTEGLGFYDGTGFRALRARDGSDFADVTAIVPTAHDGLWFKAPEGVILVPAAEIAAFLRDPSYLVNYRVFDAATDFVSPLSRDVPASSGTDAVQSGDGKLWFITQSGAAMIDPAHLVTNDVVPPVVIESIGADDHEYSPSKGVVLPKLTREFSVDYTALSLTFPERNRFRYRLLGFDKEWQNAGTLRRASYTNIPPGTYTFQVIGSNNDGVWNTTGASVSIHILPAYWQTTWFTLACLLAAVLLILFAVRWRVQQIEIRSRNRLEERLAERTRIARELHDTLLQGFQGLVLRFEAVAAGIPRDSAAYGIMGGALALADKVMTEARDRVRDLRVKETQTASLMERLMLAAEELDKHRSARFTVTSLGRDFPLNPLVCEESYWIIREALHNAFLHSRSETIGLRIAFTKRSLRVRVEDSGIGIEPNTLAFGKPGHFGLRGMRERAERIKGTLKVESRVGSGTIVDLRIPGKIAYPPQRGKMFRRLLRHLSISGREEDAS